MKIVNGCRMSSHIDLKGPWCTCRLSVLLTYICMYLMIGKGQIAQKRPYWGENRLKSKVKGKY